jgi:hypothetical protein
VQNFCTVHFSVVPIGGRIVLHALKTISSTKKSTTFFHARISRSGKGRVSDFSATRVRVEGVGSPEVLFFGKDGIFFAI